MMDQSTLLFNQDISHQTGRRLMERTGGGGGAQGERRGWGRAGGSLRTHLTLDGNLYMLASQRRMKAVRQQLRSNDCLTLGQ